MNLESGNQEIRKGEDTMRELGNQERERSGDGWGYVGKGNVVARGRDRLGNRDLTSRVIGAAIAVHRELGPGFLESFYEEAMGLELVAGGIQFERQVGVGVRYRGQVIGEHRLDLLVEGAVIVELKAVGQILDIHFAIVRSYMRALNLRDALILNFAEMPLGIRRVGSVEHFPPS